MHATASDPGRLRGVLAAAAVALAVFAGGMLLTLAGAARGADAAVFDLFTTLAAPRRPPPDIVILAIDEPSFQELGLGWPFPRSLHARVLRRILDDGAVAVGFDVVFSDPSAAAEDSALAQSIAGARGRVVLAASRERVQGSQATLWVESRPLPALLEAGAVPGEIGMQPDADYVIRRQPLAPTDFAAQLARAARSTAAGPRDRIEYLGPRGTVDTRSYYQAAIPGLLPPGFFAGKIVLVGRSGLSAVELQAGHADTFNSPFAAWDDGDTFLPGVEIQATLLANRLAGGGLDDAPALPVWLLAATLAALVVAANRRLHPAGAATVAGVAALALGALSWLAFTQWRLWAAPVLPVAAIAFTQAGATVAGFAASRRRGARVRAMFSRYVPPEVVARLVAQPELMRLGGEAREITLMFTDLADFTSHSEQLSAEQTVDLLTLYFDAMTPVIHRHHGTVDKFIGDAVMAFWGAPLADARHAEHAVRAAIEMQQAMQTVRERLRAAGLPEVRMRIGLHTGRAVVGNVGAASRFSYTAVGDAVNLASRLEGANKTFGTEILLSAATAAQLLPDIPLRPLGEVAVKGKRDAIQVYTPAAPEPAAGPAG